MAAPPTLLAEYLRTDHEDLKSNLLFQMRLNAADLERIGWRAHVAAICETLLENHGGAVASAIQQCRELLARPLL
jgi:hypothetical protein